MEDLKYDFLESLKNGTAYDFISNNYYKMTKDELVDITKEFIYASHGCGVTDMVIESLEEQWSED